MPYERKVVTTEDKSSTVYIPKLGECYHSSRGAVRESEHIFIENGLKYIYDKSDKEINILELGFGTGLNAYLSLIFSVRNGIPVFYHTVEKFPLSGKEWKALNYPALIDCGDADSFSKLHEAPWDSRQTICHRFSYSTKKKTSAESIPNTENTTVYTSMHSVRMPNRNCGRKKYSPFATKL